jgi:hypothetical protein
LLRQLIDSVSNVIPIAIPLAEKRIWAQL